MKKSIKTVLVTTVAAGMLCAGAALAVASPTNPGVCDGTRQAMFQGMAQGTEQTVNNAVAKGYANHGQAYVDENGDGVCDNAGANGKGNGNGTGYVDENGDGVCDNAVGANRNGNGAGNGNGNGTGYVDENGDGVCDNAGANANGNGNGNGAGYVDENGDGVCDNAASGKGKAASAGMGKGQHGACRG